MLQDGASQATYTDCIQVPPFKLHSCCLKPFQGEVWVWSTAKRKLHQGNNRLAETMGFFIFIFIKFTAGKGYRLYGLKIVSFPAHVPLLCLHTLGMDSFQPPLTNLVSFYAFTSQNQDKQSQIRHCELKGSQFTGLISPQVVFRYCTASHLSRQNNTRT